jgi:hypothetical protein
MADLASELDRLFAPDYLDGLPERSLDEVRAMRDECNDAETAVSYLRRVAQGRLDIVHTYLVGAAGDDAPDLAHLVERLPDIIGSGPPRPPGPGRLPSQMGPDMGQEDLTASIDKVLDGARIAELPTMERDELQRIADALSEIEARISDDRRTLHGRIDTLQAEIVKRYKSGEVDPDVLLT